VRAVLRERDYRLLLTGQAASLLGDAMAPLALAFAVLALTGSAADVGYVIAARSLPLVGLLLAGGVFADRLPRRAVMVGADLARACTQGGSAALLVTGHARVWELAALQACHGTASAFFNPAATGLTPQVVSREHLQDANGLRGVAEAAAGIAGPPLSAVLVAGVGPGWAIAADAASFAVSAACLAGLRLPAHVRLPAQRFARDLREGWAEWSSRTWVWVLTVCGAVANGLMAMFWVLGAALSRSSLGGPHAWGLILGAASVGSFAGGVAVIRLRPRQPLLVGCLALLPFALPAALLALLAPWPAIAAAALLAGAGLTFFNSLWTTSLQRHIPAAALSRVSSYDSFGSLAVRPLGFVLVGPLAGAFGERGTLWIAAGGTLLACAATLLPASVRRLDAAPLSRLPECAAATSTPTPSGSSQLGSTRPT
jgi:MFS family permease